MNIDEIERIINLLDKTQDPEVKKILKDLLAGAVARQNYIPNNYELYKDYGKCSACGLSGVQGYVCSRNDCPVRVTCTSGS
jgi:hypothetical protein